MPPLTESTTSARYPTPPMSRSSLPFRSAPARLGIVAFVLFFLISLLCRLLLLATAWHDVSWNPSLLGAFAFGVFFDAAAGLFAALPWVLLGAVAPSRFLRSRPGAWMLVALMTIFASLLIFIGTSEWFFWDEFGARFNFIAVDYLVWTQEVLGNISESYPMVPILSAIVVAGAAVAWLMKRRGVFAWAAAGQTGWRDRAGVTVVWVAAAAVAFFFVSQPAMPAFRNQFNGEIAKNGPWSFFAAFRQMELDFLKWYPALPPAEALEVTKSLLTTATEKSASAAPDDLARTISPAGPERRWNVILICMESMSGEYMSYLGNNEGLTPNLDQLAKDSLFFGKLYATGTRTVRGMEALTLTLPPTPGQSIIYRPRGKNLLTTFTPFTKRSYDCAFFYGGDGSFDYMNRFFSTSGCRIMDIGAWDDSDTTFKTSWGACDEDLFNKTISEADKDFASGKPFHFFCMTTSNHRPYDFPDGRIDLPQHHRASAVKYADWAVGDLIRKAGRKPWFKDTLFIFCADHCASSAGKSDLDVTKFHIPAMIYNPVLVPARRDDALCSQVDVMPTVFGLLNWQHDTLGYGYDRRQSPAPPERAFVSNYQKIALLRRDGLAILKPKRQSSLYDCDLDSGDLTPKAAGEGDEILRDTTALYQSASWLFKTHRLEQPAPASPPRP